MNGSASLLLDITSADFDHRMLANTRNKNRPDTV